MGSCGTKLQQEKRQYYTKVQDEKDKETVPDQKPTKNHILNGQESDELYDINPTALGEFILSNKNIEQFTQNEAIWNGIDLDASRNIEADEIQQLLVSIATTFFASHDECKGLDENKHKIRQTLEPICNWIVQNRTNNNESLSRDEFLKLIATWLKQCDLNDLKLYLNVSDIKAKTARIIAHSEFSGRNCARFCIKYRKKIDDKLKHTDEKEMVWTEINFDDGTDETVITDLLPLTKYEVCIRYQLKQDSTWSEYVTPKSFQTTFDFDSFDFHQWLGIESSSLSLSLNEIDPCQVGHFWLKKLKILKPGEADAMQFRYLWDKSGQAEVDELSNLLLCYYGRYIEFMHQVSIKGVNSKINLDTEQLQKQIKPVVDWMIKNRVNTKNILVNLEYTKLVARWLKEYNNPKYNIEDDDTLVWGNGKVTDPDMIVSVIDSSDVKIQLYSAYDKNMVRYYIKYRKQNNNDDEKNMDWEEIDFGEDQNEIVLKQLEENTKYEVIGRYRLLKKDIWSEYCFAQIVNPSDFAVFEWSVFEFDDNFILRNNNKAISSNESLSSEKIILSKNLLSKDKMCSVEWEVTIRKREKSDSRWCLGVGFIDQKEIGGFSFTEREGFMKKGEYGVYLNGGNKFQMYENGEKNQDAFESNWLASNCKVGDRLKLKFDFNGNECRFLYNDHLMVTLNGVANTIYPVTVVRFEQSIETTKWNVRGYEQDTKKLHSM